MLQAGIDFLPTLLVDLGLDFVPDADEVFYLFHTSVVTVLHLFIDGATTLHAVAPRHMMEPEQIALRTGVDVVVERAVGFTILERGVGACMGAIETYAQAVGLVVIHRAPLKWIVGDETVGLRTIMVVEPEDVVKADGHHVIDAGFARAEHETE